MKSPIKLKLFNCDVLLYLQPCDNGIILYDGQSKQEVFKIDFIPMPSKEIISKIMLYLGNEGFINLPVNTSKVIIENNKFKYF